MTKLPLEGEKVIVQGHEFTAHDVILTPVSDEYHTGLLLRFTGRCTSHEVNDTIRGTGYDGGRYGWYIR